MIWWPDIYDAFLHPFYQLFLMFSVFLVMVPTAAMLNHKRTVISSGCCDGYRSLAAGA